METRTLKETPLHAIHVALGARMMSFGGFDMPVQYSGIIDEHMAVRQAAGLFDVSHMGEFLLEGPEAFAMIQYIVSNDVSRLYDGSALYTVMCNRKGGIVDDLLVYRRRDDLYMLVVNAANIEKDFNWIRQFLRGGATLTDISDATALLAIQGPRALSIVQTLTDVPLAELKYYHFQEVSAPSFLGLEGVMLSHTGYTGEPGLEIYCKSKDAPAIWQALMEAGASKGLKPAGLGARDTLRLESGYCLYGNDITDETNPIEAGLGWITKLDKGDFVGKEPLERIKAETPARKLVGFVMEERGIPRHDFPILNLDGLEIGVVTSGTQSPMLQKGIGLGYVPNDTAYTTPGKKIGIAIRGDARKAMIIRPPFHKS